MSTFTTYTTVSGREIKVRPNFQKKHFTIKTTCGMYRTYRMNKEDFNSHLYYTGNDWDNYLKSVNYYRA